MITLAVTNFTLPKTKVIGCFLGVARGDNKMLEPKEKGEKVVS